MNKFELIKAETLQANESKYVKPMRLHYHLNGKALTWDCLKVHDSVAILMFNVTRQKLIFVKQFRPSVYFASHYSHTNLDNAIVGQPKGNESENKSTGYTLECCAGIIDKEGKSVKEIAKEEVLEETGYSVEESCLKFLSSFRSGVGVTGSLQHLFFAEVSDNQRVSKGGGIGDEQIEIVELSIQEARSLLWCQDEEAPASRPASMLFALSWFIYEYVPTLTNK